MTDLENDAALARELDHALRARRFVGDRLLDQHVAAGLEERARDGFVPAGRHRHRHRVDPADLSLSRLASDFNRPNGLCFSLDESLLYINDTPESQIRVYDVKADGSLANGRLFATARGDGPGGPDGMKIDSEGNVYCCAAGGLHVFGADGRLLGRLGTPMQATNFTFGDADLRGVYLTGITTLYRVRARVAGLPLF